jgi:hypothetical protein
MHGVGLVAEVSNAFFLAVACRTGGWLPLALSLSVELAGGASDAVVVAWSSSMGEVWAGADSMNGVDLLQQP